MRWTFFIFFLIFYTVKVPNNKFRNPGDRRGGFSLVELLITIAVIAVIAGLVIPYLGDMTNTASEKKDQRNAQTIASLAQCAGAAGATFVVSGDVVATVKSLRDGISPNGGAFKGRVFKLPGIADGDITRALPYLTLSGDDLKYHTTANP